MLLSNHMDDLMGSGPTDPTSAVSVEASTATVLPGASPRAVLQELRVVPIPFRAAKALLVREHYLHSMAGGTRISLGVFHGKRLKGALTFGVGPMEGHSLITGASPDEIVTLSRFWLSDDLPPNSETRVLGVGLRALRKHTKLKAVLSYADPSRGHLGTIYQGGGWIYTGLSQATPLYDLGDRRPRHGRTLGHALGTHSIDYLRGRGVLVKLVPQAAKHRYIFLLNPSSKANLRVPVLPYPKKESLNGSS